MVCVHTLTPGGKGQSTEYFKILGKNTIFNEHPVFQSIFIVEKHRFFSIKKKTGVFFGGGRGNPVAEGEMKIY